MNYRFIFYRISYVIYLEAALMLLPFITAIIYGETVLPFLVTMVIALAFGSLLHFGFKPKTNDIFAKEGLILVSLSWLFLSAIGALPFVFSGEIPSFIDAFFETVSGFTTTGASLVPNVEVMSRGILFWRSFTHWVGGMGILVFITMLSSKAFDRSMHILRAEMPGPTVDKLVPRARDTAKILYLIYLVMTVVEIVALLIAGMPMFDSIVHALGTAGTGGFGIKAASIGAYNPACQWIIAIFMALFGINFNLYYLLLLRRFRGFTQSEELHWYLGIILFSTVIITANIMPLYGSLGEALRTAFFQVSSIATTTGYATADFTLWPALSQHILFLLMFIGACAGSTAGGLKVSRLVLLLKVIRREFQRAIHPRSANVIRFENKKVEENVLSGVVIYFALYMFAILGGFLLICWEPFGFETVFSSVVACFNNIGPGLAAVGPAGNFAMYSPFSKLVLSFAMLLGRLEIYPILLTLLPSSWRKK